MLTVDEALEHVRRRVSPKPAAEVALAEALGLVLAEDVTSDIDSPPHDKSMVDGYAVVAADLKEGDAELEVLEEVVAGNVPTREVSPGRATRIMTGAPLPPGADAVVMIERTQLVPGHSSGLGRVRIAETQVTAGQNILRRGVSMRRGDVVLQAGARLRPIEVGLLAEVGKDRLRATPRPTVAVLSTGNELVPADLIPAAGQIRNSNGPMLIASVATAGATAIDLGIGRDDRNELRRLIARGLEADLLVLSGGVSAGVLDLVPGVLEELGVQQVFHKVRLKPGKPLWFGVLPGSGDSARDRLVFGLPGNPVSSLVCFELFVRPAIHGLAGVMAAEPRWTSATLTLDFSHRGDRPTYHPAVLQSQGSVPSVTPLAWQGSADLRTLATATALIRFSAGERTYRTGEDVEIAEL